MANPPPPYDNITGISRAVMKDNAQESITNYNGNARPGELVVDQTNDNLYVGNSSGSLTLIASGAGTETWATLGNKTGAAGPTIIALGQNAGLSAQGTAAVAIGLYAGQTSQGADAVAIGNSVAQASQGQQAVAIGWYAGNTSQGAQAVAIGTQAGYNIQGALAVAIGIQSGYDTQGNNSVAIGDAAGYLNQGINSVAIGSKAGISGQANNSIVINATGNNLNQTTANTLTVKPVRAVTSVTFAAPTAGSMPAGFSPMYYNPTTGEIIVITT